MLLAGLFSAKLLTRLYVAFHPSIVMGYGLAELYNLVKSVKKFVYSLTYAINFLVYGGLAGGYWLIVASLAVNQRVWVVGGATIFLVSFIVSYVIDFTIPKVEGVKSPEKSGSTMDAVFCSTICSIWVRRSTVCCRDSDS